MPTYLISYELVNEEYNLEKLMTAIKSVSTSWIYPLESTWLINSPITVMGIYDRLSVLLDSADKLLVTEITNNCKGYLNGKTIYSISQLIKN